MAPAEHLTLLVRSRSVSVCAGLDTNDPAIAITDNMTERKFVDLSGAGQGKRIEDLNPVWLSACAALPVTTVGSGQFVQHSCQAWPHPHRHPRRCHPVRRHPGGAPRAHSRRIEG